MISIDAGGKKKSDKVANTFMTKTVSKWGSEEGFLNLKNSNIHKISVTDVIPNGKKFELSH